LECAQKVADLNKNENVKFVEDEFATNLSLNGQKYDVVIFNPPYVVTSKDELSDAQEKKGIEASWAGGEDGTEVLLQVIPQIKKILSEKGVFYLLLIQENLKVIGVFETLGFKWSVVMKREV
jgi:release factor glutamine methyltransferase